MPPLVSVIIPTYNRAGLLPCAIKSVYDQDYSDVEIIVVDDGSTDNTNAVLTEFYNAHTNIIIKTLPAHPGQCSARNAGLDLARGKYIQLLDSDDALVPGIIKKHVDFLEAHPEIDLVYGDLMLSNSFVMNNPMVKKNPEFKPDIRPGTPIDYDMKKTLIKNLKNPLDPKHSILYLYTPNYKPLRISTGTGLFRRNKVRYDPEIEKNWNCSADVDFWGQLIMAGVKFAYLQGLAFECRVHGQNITNQIPPGTEKRFGVRKYIYNKLKKQVKDEN